MAFRSKTFIQYARQRLAMDNDIASELFTLHTNALNVLGNYALALERAGAPPRFGCGNRAPLKPVNEKQVLSAILVANENSQQANDLLDYISRYSRHPGVQEAARKTLEHRC